MAIGEPLLSSFLQVLFERLASPELLQFARKVKVLSKLKKCEETWKMIEALLIDAEEKQLADSFVQTWLSDLLNLAYRLEDILDEFAIETASSSKVRNLIPAVFTSMSPTAVKFNVSMASKIKGITSRLEKLYKKRVEFGLKMIAGGTSTSTTTYQRPPSARVPIEAAIYGRDEDKAKILDMVFSDEPTNANFSVITIVGMAGIGKTTLARQVYDDKTVLENFNPRAWVRFSADFDELDVLRISKAIIASVTSRSCDLKDKDQALLRLKKLVAGRKFLFVVDNFSMENYDLLETLKSSLMEGVPGSKIIITTDSEEVASEMGDTKCHRLELLSNDDCWLIFAEQAFPSAHRNLKVIQEKVVENCKGSPLVARILGGILRSKEREEWEDILNSNIWQLPAKSMGIGLILPVLRLSYYNLPSHLKRCITYCAILPKGYEFKEEELVLLWMTEGLIQQSNDNMQLEDLGNEYFHDIVSRSIFQKSDSDDSKFGMHDLIHGLANMMSGQNSLTMTNYSKGRVPFFYRLKKVHHLSYSGGYHDATVRGISKLKNLRTFLFLLTDGYNDNAVGTKLSDLLRRCKRLRVLSLRKYPINEVPDSIGNLRFLRYLNFSGTEITSLPELTNMLFNLQVLILRDCFCLLKLPSDMGNLINLRHLDIMGANLIREMPLGIENWEPLRTLSNFIVGKSVGSSIKAVKDLKFLNGKLCISSLENVIDSQKEVVLSDKKGLEVLVLEWGSLFDDSRNEAVEYDVLDMLQPHQNLKELTIKCYGGIRFPSWLGGQSFYNMVVLTLENCEKCISLPSLGLLSLLKELIIRGMKELKSIGPEIYGEGCSKPFLSLEKLSFEDLDECEHWDRIGENEQVEVFSRLQKLSIIRCPKLKGALPDHLPSLQELVIHECVQLMVSFSSLPMGYTLEVDKCRATVCRGPADSVILSYFRRFCNWYKQVFQKVECLQIVNCEELIYFWQNEILLQSPPKGLHSLITLRELCIENCPNLTGIPEVDFLSVLSILKIENCNDLMSLPDGLQRKNSCLQHLRIGGCHSLTFIFKSQLPSSLKRLEVKNCGKLQYLIDDGEATCASPTSEIINNTSLSFLQHLYVSQCPSLTCLSSRVELLAVLKHLEISGCPKLVTLLSSSQLPETLQHLNVVDCPKLVSIAESFHSNMSLEYIKIWRCKKLKLIPENLTSLSCLHDIYIWDCPSLVSFPEGGLPDTNLRLFSIDKCRQLRALPQQMHRLNSLQELELRQCPSITSIEEGLPTSLTSLSIADVSIYRPLIECGLHKLTSLKTLEIRGCVYAESFPQEETGLVLPTSLTGLTIARFPKLKYLSSAGLQKLSSLEYLSISDCPVLESLPESGLPSSLVQLYIYDCPLLKKRCKKDRGEEWFKISHIPRIQIDGRFIEDCK